ncbi:hypothetical protein SOHN41_04005 [Shewanella sp. HN-41]|nr:hypothetical protein SOHN41_04005 [Shewanella sp. HN-41]
MNDGRDCDNQNSIEDIAAKDGSQANLVMSAQLGNDSCR